MTDPKGKMTVKRNALLRPLLLGAGLLAGLLACHPPVPVAQAAPPGAGGPDGGGPLVDGGADSGSGARCGVFPPDNPWNTDISQAPVHPQSAQLLASIGGDTPLHADFGTVWEGAPNGIPYVVVPGSQAKVPIHFTAYGDESDPGPYPIPASAPIEGGPASTGDRHVIAVDLDGCKLYELYRAFPQADGSWKADSGAVFDLRSNRLRTLGWTSADAAGLPIYPGLVRSDEVRAGAIRHALRFTVSRTRRAFILPATHYASSRTDPSLPPMGLRLRLRASFDLSGFSPANRVILRALQRYGMILADNGSDLFLSGAPSPHWSDDDLGQLRRVRARDFEVVYTGPTRTQY